MVSLTIHFFFFFLRIPSKELIVAIEIQ